MATHTLYPELNKSYFVTFTCYKWLNLIEISNSYDAFYKWFDYLKLKNIKLIGYVIMPNHFHGIFYLPSNCNKNINQIIANGKRFLAYDIIKNLRVFENYGMLSLLEKDLTFRERHQRKKHKVFRLSSDKKELTSLQMLQTKLSYLHRNPCQGNWNLANSYEEYKHSSVLFYEKNIENKFIEDYRECW